MTAGSDRPVAQVGDSPELLAFSEAARRQALMPGWEFQSAQSDEPIPVAQPYRWSWAEVLRPMMVRAYDVVDPVKAERRNLIMSNPGLTRAATTQTLIAAVQGVLPGEIAPAHRHTAGALRFMIEGCGSLTNVNGEPCSMDPASLILTPQWSWHDHANETERPVIWLDVLDVPFIMGINQWFWEPFPEAIQPRSRPRGENLSASALASSGRSARGSTTALRRCSSTRGIEPRERSQSWASSTRTTGESRSNTTTPGPAVPCFRPSAATRTCCGPVGSLALAGLTRARSPTSSVAVVARSSVTRSSSGRRGTVSPSRTGCGYSTRTARPPSPHSSSARRTPRSWRRSASFAMSSGGLSDELDLTEPRREERHVQDQGDGPHRAQRPGHRSCARLLRGRPGSRAGAARRIPPGRGPISIRADQRGHGDRPFSHEARGGAGKWSRPPELEPFHDGGGGCRLRGVSKASCRARREDRGRAGPPMGSSWIGAVR